MRCEYRHLFIHMILLLPASVLLWLLMLPGTALAAPAAQEEMPSHGNGVVAVTGSLELPPGQSPINTVVVLLDARHVLTATTTGWAPVEGQIMGQVVTTAATITETEPLSQAAGVPVNYRVALPQTPIVAADAAPADDPAARGSLYAYQLAVGEQILGSPYLEMMEQAAALTSLQIDPVDGTVIGGALLLYADTHGLPFPEDAGADGHFFTADDEIMSLPAGYSVATLADGRVTLDRSRTAVMEPGAGTGANRGAVIDLRDLDLVAGVEQLIDQLDRRYSHGDTDAVDWASLRRRFVPLVEQTPAEDGDETSPEEDTLSGAANAEDADLAAYYMTLHTLAQELGDYHITVAPGPDAPPAVNQAAATASGQSLGNLGITVVQLEDGRVIVAETVPGTPADNAEVRAGAEILAVDGVPVHEAIDGVAYHGFPGTPAAKRLLQVQDLLRYPVGTDVVLEIRPPDSERSRAVTLTAGQYPVRRKFSVAGQPAPATYRFLDDYGYISWPAFDRPRVTVAMLQDFLQQADARASGGVIIDLRGNPGGDEIMAATMASFFFDADTPLIMDDVERWRLDEAQNAFVRDTTPYPPIYAPADNAFGGLVTLLVDESCGGACELFVYLLQKSARGTVVGQQATAGGAGAVAEVLLPGDIHFTFPETRLQHADGRGLIHGRGVQPDVRVPVVEEIELAKATGDDPVIDAAVAYMDAVQLQPVPVTFSYVGVDSVGPRSWLYDDETRQLRHRSGSSLTIIPQQSDDVDTAVAAFVANLDGTATFVERVETGGDQAVRSWAVYEADLFGRPAWIAGTVEAGDSLLVVLFVANPDQTEPLYGQVLLPFLENFTMEGAQ